MLPVSTVKCIAGGCSTWHNPLTLAAVVTTHTAWNLCNAATHLRNSARFSPTHMTALDQFCAVSCIRHTQCHSTPAVRLLESNSCTDACTHSKAAKSAHFTTQPLKKMGPVSFSGFTVNTLIVVLSN